MTHKILAGLLWSIIMAIPYCLASVACVLTIFTSPFGWSAIKWYSEYLLLFSKAVLAAMERGYR